MKQTVKQILCISLVLLLVAGLIPISARAETGGYMTMIEPGKAEPGEADPGEANPGEADPGEANPGEADPGEANPGEADPGEADPGEANPGEADPGEADPGEADPGEADPGEADPGEADPGEANPGEADPGEADPGEADPGEADPGEANPGEANPGEADPGEEDPGEADPGKAEPEETESKSTGISAEAYLISPGDILYPNRQYPVMRTMAAQATSSTVTVVSEPKWQFTSNPLYYNHFSVDTSVLPLPWTLNKGRYWVTDFSYFNLSNGQIGYCIQPFYPGTTGEFAPDSWSDFSWSARRGVALALVYGAPNNGDTSGDAYLATAALVRDFAMGYRNENGYLGVYKNADSGEMITESPFGNRLQTSYPAAYQLYAEYVTAIQNHGRIPSFAKRTSSDATTYELQPDGKGNYTLTLTDTNGVLAKHFHFSSSISGLTFTKNGNSLVITATPAAAAQLTNGVTIGSNLAYDYTSPETAVTVWRKSADSQKIVVLDAATDPAAAYFKLTAKAATGNLRFVKKTNTGLGLYGWYFDLYRDAACTDKIGTYGPTKGDGTYTITDLEPGTYYVREVDESALYPYWDYDTTVHAVVIAVGVTSDVTVTNTHNGKLSIKKEMAGDGPLAGWNFKVTRVANNQVLGTFTTDENGEFDSGLLEPGPYLVEEILPENSPYYCVGENPVTVTVTAGKTETVTFTNALRSGKITVEKVNPAGEHLADAKFLLEWSNDDGATWNPVFYSDAEVPVMGGSSNADIVDGCVTTDSTGVIVFENLHPFAQYRLTEVDAPDGYSLLSEPILIGELPVEDFTVALTVRNSPKFLLPLTGAYGPILAGVGVAITVLCACCLLRRRRMTNKK